MLSESCALEPQETLNLIDAVTDFYLVLVYLCELL
jgi:hypothetical protein